MDSHHISWITSIQLYLCVLVISRSDSGTRCWHVRWCATFVCMFSIKTNTTWNDIRGWQFRQTSPLVQVVSGVNHPDISRNDSKIPGTDGKKTSIVRGQERNKDFPNIASTAGLWAGESLKLLENCWTAAYRWGTATPYALPEIGFFGSCICAPRHEHDMNIHNELWSIGKLYPHQSRYNQAPVSKTLSSPDCFIHELCTSNTASAG